MMRALAAMRRLRAPERRLAIVAGAWLLAARVLLPLAGFERVQRMLRFRGACRATELGVARIAWIVNRTADRLPFATTCLMRSLVLSRLLHTARIPHELKIGVRLVDGEFDAHAWVEHEGIAMQDRTGALHTYAVILDERPLAEPRA